MTADYLLFIKFFSHACVKLMANIGKIGANGDIRMVVKGAPALFLFCLVQIGTHLGITLAAAQLLGFSRRDALIASNANVGGESSPSLQASEEAVA